MPTETVCREADRLIAGDRDDSYGDPVRNLERTALMWTAILDTSVTAQQVALCLAAVKISRECHTHKRDNLVDGCGYLAIAQRVAERYDDEALSKGVRSGGAA